MHWSEPCIEVSGEVCVCVCAAIGFLVPQLGPSEEESQCNLAECAELSGARD